MYPWDVASDDTKTERDAGWLTKSVNLPIEVGF